MYIISYDVTNFLKCFWGKVGHFLFHYCFVNRYKLTNCTPRNYLWLGWLLQPSAKVTGCSFFCTFYQKKEVNWVPVRGLDKLFCWRCVMWKGAGAPLSAQVVGVWDSDILGLVPPAPHRQGRKWDCCGNFRILNWNRVFVFLKEKLSANPDS